MPRWPPPHSRSLWFRIHDGSYTAQRAGLEPGLGSSSEVSAIATYPERTIGSEFILTLSKETCESREDESRYSVRGKMAGTTRLELATSAVTGQRSNQLNYVPAVGILTDGGQCRTRTCDLLLVRQAL
jgi:hypothetical protein